MRKKDVSAGGGSTSLVKELPLGCYASSQNSSVLLTSFGLQEWDELSGGGCLVGGMACVEQDEGTRHWKALARYFASEGVAAGQGLAVVSTRESDATAFVRTDVGAVTDSMPAGEQVAAEAMNVEGVKIAWRYKAQLKEKSVSGSSEVSKWPRRCHYFDLAKAADVPAASADAILHTGSLEETWAAIECVVERYNRGISDPNARAPPILRLVLLNFGCALWHPADQLPSFLLRLRSLVRKSLCACLVCVAPSAKSSLCHFFDQSVQLNSFEGCGDTGAAASYPGYSGTLLLKKTVSLFAASQWKPDCRQFLFRRTRRTLQIERLYMPPEDRAQSSSSLACAATGGGGGASSLDF